MVGRFEGVEGALFLLPFFTAPLSLISSGYIIYLILTRRGTTLCKPREQILLGLSLLDMSFSFALSFSTLPAPAIMNFKSPSTLVRIGTVGTCSAQGFFVQLGMGAPIYNACLCIYYFVSIRYKVSDETFMRWTIPCMHIITLTFAFGSAIAGLFMGIYNSAGVMGCWIHHSRSLCFRDPRYCGRGPRADDFIVYFGLVIIGACFVFVVLSMIALACTVRGIEIRSRRWEFQNARGKKNMPLTRRTIETGLLYSVSFIAIWLPSILLGFAFEGGTIKKLKAGYRCVQVLSVIMQPLQGFFNMIIYTSPDWLPRLKRLKCCSALPGRRFFRNNLTSVDENDEEDQQDEAELSIDLFSVKDAIEDHLSREFTPMAQRRGGRRGRSRYPGSRDNSETFSAPFSEGDLNQLSSTFLRAELETLQENSREGSRGSSTSLRGSSFSSASMRRSSFEEMRFEIESSSLSLKAVDMPFSIVEASDDGMSEENEDDSTNNDLENGETENEEEVRNAFDEMKVELESPGLHYDYQEEEKRIEVADGTSGDYVLQMPRDGAAQQIRMETMTSSVMDSSDGTTIDFVSSSDCSTVQA